MGYQVIASESMFEGKVFDVRRDQIELPDGRQFKLDLVVHPGAVALIPIDERGRVWFVRQYRHASGGELLELPAGTLESGETPEHCAARECREEIGMSPGGLEHLGGFYLAPGYSTEYLNVFLATDLRPDPSPSDTDEDIQVEKLTVSDLKELLETGGLQDAKSLAAIAMASGRIGRTSPQV